MKIQTIPNFFILGAAKAGTTTLYDVLKQHPQIYLPFAKEPMFFSHDDNFHKGLDWYSHTYFGGAERFPARGEATPHYLYWSEKVAPRIRDSYPNATLKFILILRDPVEQAYSRYWNMVKEGKENLSFEEALKVEQERIENEWHFLHHGGYMTYGYHRGGCYASQLDHFLSLFPKKDFCFLIQEDIIDSSLKVVSKLCNFLDVDNNDNLSLVHGNPAALSRSMRLQRILQGPSKLKDIIKSVIPFRLRYRMKGLMIQANLRRITYPSVQSNIAQDLRARYDEEIRRLEEIIERDLSHWRED